MNANRDAEGFNSSLTQSSPTETSKSLRSQPRASEHGSGGDTAPVDDMDVIRAVVLAERAVLAAKLDQIGDLVAVRANVVSEEQWRGERALLGDLQRILVDSPERATCEGCGRHLPCRHCEPTEVTSIEAGHVVQVRCDMAALIEKWFTNVCLDDLMWTEFGLRAPCMGEHGDDEDGE